MNMPPTTQQQVERISEIWNEHLAVAKSLPDLTSGVSKAVDLIYASLASGGQLLVAGNGGSAADAQHITAELTGRFMRERRPLRALALHANTSSLTAIGNDYGFDRVPAMFCWRSPPAAIVEIFLLRLKRLERLRWA
jgi:phosphoheptose isomerase